MKLLDAIEKRRAYRAFSEETLDRDTLTRLAQAGPYSSLDYEQPAVAHGNGHRPRNP